MINPLIIFGSSRSKGHTFDAVNHVTSKFEKYSYIDLADYTVNDYDYEFKNSDDDFKIIMQHFKNHDTIILASPVYWYTMSAPMKRFVDRLSDLLSSNNVLGKLLRGKKLAVISSYQTYPEGTDGFEKIFINIARYLGMNYLGCYFYYSGEDNTVLSKNADHAEEFFRNICSN